MSTAKTTEPGTQVTKQPPWLPVLPETDTQLTQQEVLGQYPTPAPLANFMASMFTTDWDRSIREARSQARKLGGDAIFIGSGGRFGAATSARSDLDVTVYRSND